MPNPIQLRAQDKSLLHSVEWNINEIIKEYQSYAGLYPEEIFGDPDLAKKQGKLVFPELRVSLVGSYVWMLELWQSQQGIGQEVDPSLMQHLAQDIMKSDHDVRIEPVNKEVTLSYYHIYILAWGLARRLGLRPPNGMRASYNAESKMGDVKYDISVEPENISSLSSHAINVVKSGEIIFNKEFKKHEDYFNRHVIETPMINMYLWNFSDLKRKGAITHKEESKLRFILKSYIKAFRFNYKLNAPTEKAWARFIVENREHYEIIKNGLIDKLSQKGSDISEYGDLKDQLKSFEENLTKIYEESKAKMLEKDEVLARSEDEKEKNKFLDEFNDFKYTQLNDLSKLYNQHAMLETDLDSFEEGSFLIKIDNPFEVIDNDERLDDKKDRAIEKKEKVLDKIVGELMQKVDDLDFTDYLDKNKLEHLVDEIKLVKNKAEEGIVNLKKRLQSTEQEMKDRRASEGQRGSNVGIKKQKGKKENPSKPATARQEGSTIVSENVSVNILVNKFISLFDGQSSINDILRGISADYHKLSVSQKALFMGALEPRILSENSKIKMEDRITIMSELFPYFGSKVDDYILQSNANCDAYLLNQFNIFYAVQPFSGARSFANIEDMTPELFNFALKNIENAKIEDLMKAFIMSHKGKYKSQVYDKLLERYIFLTKSNIFKSNDYQKKMHIASAGGPIVKHKNQTQGRVRYTSGGHIIDPSLLNYFYYQSKIVEAHLLQSLFNNFIYNQLKSEQSFILLNKNERLPVKPFEVSDSLASFLAHIKELKNIHGKDKASMKLIETIEKSFEDNRSYYSDRFKFMHDRLLKISTEFTPYRIIASIFPSLDANVLYQMNSKAAPGVIFPPVTPGECLEADNLTVFLSHRAHKMIESWKIGEHDSELYGQVHLGKDFTIDCLDSIVKALASIPLNERRRYTTEDPLFWKKFDDFKAYHDIEMQKAIHSSSTTSVRQRSASASSSSSNNNAKPSTPSFPV